MSAPTKSPSRESPLLCYVTDRNNLAARKVSSVINQLLQKIAEAVAAGVDWVQIREKDLSGKDLAHITKEALQYASKHSKDRLTTRIVVNDRLDVALTSGAAGVHLGEDSVPARDARALVKRIRGAATQRDFLIGVSCHSLESASAAAESGADYIFFGPVFATPSKTSFGSPQGLKLLADVCRKAAVPVIAIGGITLDNAASCISAGATGLAAIRLFQDAGSVANQVAALREALGSPSTEI